jgi:hypothetical protein
VDLLKKEKTFYKNGKKGRECEGGLVLKGEK